MNIFGQLQANVATHTEKILQSFSIVSQAKQSPSETGTAGNSALPPVFR